MGGLVPLSILCRTTRGLLRRQTHSGGVFGVHLLLQSVEIAAQPTREIRCAGKMLTTSFQKSGGWKFSHIEAEVGRDHLRP